jgi:flagellar motility protein MotE (MotC chaperone)
MTALAPIFTPTRRCQLLAAGVLTALLMAAAPAAAQPASAEPEPTAAEPAAEASSEPTEIERFCSNISDAARDRRYALQTQELETLRKDIDERVKLLEEKRAEYEAWLKRRDDFLAKVQDNVAKIYATMKPDAAAERLAAVNEEVAAGILMKLDSRKAGVILNEMDRKAAAELTRIMASAARKEDPS